MLCYTLNGKELGIGICDEDCDDCEFKFQCYTTKDDVLLIVSKLTPRRYNLIRLLRFTSRDYFAGCN